MALGIVDHTRTGTHSTHPTTPRSTMTKLHPFSYASTSLRYPPRPPPRPLKPQTLASLPSPSTLLISDEKGRKMEVLRPLSEPIIPAVPASSRVHLRSEKIIKAEPLRLPTLKKIKKPTWLRSKPIPIARAPVPIRPVKQPSPSPITVLMKTSTVGRGGYPGAPFNEARAYIMKTFRACADAAEGVEKDLYQKKATMEQVNDRDIVCDLELLEQAGNETIRINAEALRIMAILHACIANRKADAASKAENYESAQREYEYLEGYLEELETNVKQLRGRKPFYLDERKTEKAKRFRKLLDKVPERIKSERLRAAIRTRFAKNLLERISPELNRKGPTMEGK